MCVGCSPEPIYVPEHMPENHRKFLEYNTDSFLAWGKNVGCSTLIVVKHFLYMHKVEQQGYKSCASLMKLADRYGTERLENACVKALSYTPSPSLKNISTILKNGQDKVLLIKKVPSMALPEVPPITKEVTVHNPSVNHR